MMTTEQSYEDDLAVAGELIEKFIDPSQCDGSGRKWANDALNDAWQEGISIEEWTARAVLYIPTGFRRGAQ